MNNIVLCGFMGCGKSTVGRALADATGRSFVDMDSYIEQTAGRTISAIFETDGEGAFRALEHAACATLGAEQGLIIATGGGAVLREDNVAALKAGGTLVWLRVSADTVLARLKDDTSRPLLRRPDKHDAVHSLMTTRAPLYARAADITVEADYDPKRICQAILTALDSR